MKQRLMIVATIAVLVATLAAGHQGLHLAASPEGPYYAITFTGGSPG